MVDKKFVFKVSVDAKNKEKLMPVFNVLRLSDDPDIIQSVSATATPVKVIPSTYMLYSFKPTYYLSEP